MADRLPPKKLGLGLMSKNLMFWVLIILVSLVMYQMIGSRRDDYFELSYSKFSQELERNNVAEVEVESGKFARGTFKQSVSDGEGNDVTRFKSTLPIKDSEAFIERLEQKGVLISGKEPKPGFGSIFINLLPWGVFPSLVSMAAPTIPSPGGIL